MKSSQGDWPNCSIALSGLVRIGWSFMVMFLLRAAGLVAGGGEHLLVVKPNFLSSSGKGAEAPKLCIAMMVPLRPT